MPSFEDANASEPVDAGEVNSGETKRTLRSLCFSSAAARLENDASVAEFLAENFCGYKVRIDCSEV